MENQDLLNLNHCACAGVQDSNIFSTNAATYKNFINITVGSIDANEDGRNQTWPISPFKGPRPFEHSICEKLLREKF